MGLWSRYGAPRFIKCACGSSPITWYRQKVVPQAYGHVLEIGCGSGQNFSLYDTAKVSHLSAIEPDPLMLRWARKAHASIGGLSATLTQTGAEDTRLPDASVDTAVFTFVLCTIPDWQAALKEARRVLKPGGQVIFCEHGLAPDAGVAKWQNRLNGIWGKLGGGCSLIRKVDDMLSQSGFALQDVTRAYTPNTPRFAGYVTRGVATL